jgi:hypothetical protein
VSRKKLHRRLRISWLAAIAFPALEFFIIGNLPANDNSDAIWFWSMVFFVGFVWATTYALILTGVWLGRKTGITDRVLKRLMLGTWGVGLLGIGISAALAIDGPGWMPGRVMALCALTVVAWPVAFIFTVSRRTRRKQANQLATR